MVAPNDLEAEVVLVGTGLAPLLAAKALSEQQRSVVVLNPEWSFFQEESELPFEPDPFQSPMMSPEQLLGLLRPPFPGAVEWLPLSEVSRGGENGFRVVSAPFVRTRSRIRVFAPLEVDFEERFLGCEEHGHRPLEYRDLAALRRFPGYASPQAGIFGTGAKGIRGLWLPHEWDLDVQRYRVGIHEFLLDRLGPERVRTGLTDLEPLSGSDATGVRFRVGDEVFQIPRADRVVVFWTPRLSRWLSRMGVGSQPQTDFWERWTLVSRDRISGELSGEFGDLWVMPDVEGDEESSHRLSVYRRVQTSDRAASAIGEGSLEALSRLCLGLMGWDKFSIRAYRTQEIFRERPRVLTLTQPSRWSIVLGADGPITQVVRASQMIVGAA